MAENKPEKVTRIIVNNKMKQRWERIAEDDYPILMAEYARLTRLETQLTRNEIKETLEQVKKIQNKVNSIQQGVSLIALFFILSALATGCYIMGF